MATILPFPKAKAEGPSGLTTQECEAVHAEAFVLIKQGLATGVSVHDNGHYMCVFDNRGERFFIGRVDGVCYIFDQGETMVARNPRFEAVLEALEELLTPLPQIPNSQ